MILHKKAIPTRMLDAGLLLFGAFNPPVFWFHFGGAF